MRPSQNSNVFFGVKPFKSFFSSRNSSIHQAGTVIQVNVPVIHLMLSSCNVQVTAMNFLMMQREEAIHKTKGISSFCFGSTFPAKFDNTIPSIQNREIIVDLAGQAVVCVHDCFPSSRHSQEPPDAGIQAWITDNLCKHCGEVFTHDVQEQVLNGHCRGTRTRQTVNVAMHPLVWMTKHIGQCNSAAAFVHIN